MENGFLKKIDSYLYFRRLRFFVFLTAVLAHSLAARAEPRLSLQADGYQLDVQGGRPHDGPKIVGLWATGTFAETPFKVQMPQSLFTGRKLTVHYQWAGGTPWAGQTERVELHWRQNQGDWRTETLGDGFRDPHTGQLLLFPIDLHFQANAVGALELKFIYHLANGERIQDGGASGVLSFFVAPKTNTKLSFDADWQSKVNGGLVAGQSFDLHYDTLRLTRQLNLQGAEQLPWSVVAHVRFDDQSPQEYPLVALIPGQRTRVVSFVPTVVIPQQSRRMSIWFIAFHESNSYFDSNFGLNYNFDILSE